MKKLLIVFVLLLIIPVRSFAAHDWANTNIWVDNWGKKYRQGGGDGTSGNSTLTIKCAKNEFESFQVLVYNADDEDATGVNITVTESTSAITDIYIYKMWYINCSTASRDEYSTGYYPDPLIPKVDRYYGETRAWSSTGVTVPVSKVQGFWIDIGTTSSTPAGTYTFNVAVTKSGETNKTATVTLTVWNFTLPSTATIPSICVIDSVILDDGHGESYSTAQSAALEEYYVKMLIYHRLGVGTSDGGLLFTSRDGSYNITGWTNWMTAYEDALDGNLISSGPYTGAELSAMDHEWMRGTYVSEASYKNLVGDFRDKFIAEGWDHYTKLFPWTTDEPSTEAGYNIALDKAGDCIEIDASWKNAFVTKQRVSGLYNPDAPRTSFDDTGTYCPCFYKFTYRAPWQSESQKVARSTYPNDRVWGYITCDMAHGCNASGGAAYNNAPDMMLETPPILTRSIMWIGWFYDTYGFLYYDINLHYGTDYDSVGDPWGNVKNQGGNGEGNLVYPGVPSCTGRSCDTSTPDIGGTNDIPVESIRLKLLREAMEDREYFELARAAGYESETDTYVNTLFTQTTDPGPYYCVKTTPATLETARENIANLLSAESPLQGIVIQGDN